MASGSAAPAGGVRPHGHFGGVEWALTAMVALIWGASFLFIKMGVESFGAGLVPAMRIGFGGLALVCVPASHRPIDRRDWPAIVLLALIWMAVPFLLFSIAEETVPTAVTGMINGAVPLSVAATGALWHRKAPSLRRTLGLLTGLAGVTSITLSASHDGRGSTDTVGILMLVVGVVCYGVAANVATPLQRRYGSLAVLLRIQLVAFVVSLPYGLWTARTATFTWAGLGAMVFLGSLGTGLAYVAGTTLMGRTDATRGSIGVFLTPIVATLLGVTVRHEALPPGVLVGAVLILAGAVLTSRPEPG